MNIDPYAILGVNKSATQDEIKKAYRQKALKDHPDRNPDDPQAEERFKIVSMAYGLIGDEKSRKEYDQSRRPRSRPQQPPPGFNDIFRNANINFGNQPPGSNGTWEDLFGSFQSAHRKPFAIRARVDCSLEDLVRGTQKTFVMDGQSINFSIPKGVRNDMTIVVPLRGGQELHASVNVIKHPLFTVDGDDLRCIISVPIKTAICGGEINAKTLESDVRLKIAKCINSHTKLRVKNYGLFRSNGSRGSIIYEIRLTFDGMSIEDKKKFADYIS